MTSETLCAAFQATSAARGESPALRMSGHPGLTWSDYATAVRRLTAGLVGLGVGRADRVALLTGPRPEFHIVDTALLHARATPFSIHETEPLDRAVDFLGVADARILVTEQRLLFRAREIAAAAPGEVRVICVDGAVGAAELTLVDVERSAPQGLDVEAVWRSVEPEDIATLIFTSGTTGTPKAVQLSHRAIVAAARSTFAMAPAGPGQQEVLSYLPLNHSADRFMNHYSSLVHGLTIHSVPDPERLYDEIRRVRPTRLFGVPRVYEKLVDRLQVALGDDPGLESRRQLVLRAVRADKAGPTHDGPPADEVRAALAELAGVRAAIGLDRAEFLGVAAAPSAYPMLEFLLSVGLRVSDLWGLSEIIMCTLNPPDAIRLGTVGRFLDGIEGRIAEDGEILVRGLHDFSGYLGDPERTAEIRDAEGWVHTGDVGSIDDGYLTIRGRKKEILITASGKNIAPGVIEGAVKSASPLIDHVLAIADGRRYVTALIALDRSALIAYFGGGDFAELARREDVRREVNEAVNRANTGLSRPEQVRSFRIVEHEWLPGSNEVTATAKLRRNEITSRYVDVIEELYT